MRALVIWFVDKLLGAIEAWLHPDQAQRWAEIKQRSQALDDAHAQLNQAEADLKTRQAESEKRAAELQTKIDAVNAAIAEDEKTFDTLTEKRKQTADDLAKAKADIANQSDHDAVRGDV